MRFEADIEQHQKWSITMADARPLKGLFQKLGRMTDGGILEKLLGDVGPLKTLAEAVADTKEWKNGNGIQATEMLGGLRKLLSRGLIDAATLDAAIESGKPKKMLEVLSKGISEFQKIVRITRDPLMVVNGILAPAAARLLKEFSGCNPREGRGKKLANDSTPKLRYEMNFGEISALYCYTDPAVIAKYDGQFGPNMTIAMISDAWDAWLDHIPLKVMTNGVDKKNANVAIRVGQVDGKEGDKLADADVAGPDFLKLQLCTLKIDEDEPFTEERFRWMVTHELGHILGMGHYAEEGMIMGEWLDTSVKEPTPRDIQKVQAIWGKA